MAKTIGQIQALITSGLDQRQIINELADYIQANPGGGGGGATPGLQAVLTEDSVLTENALITNPTHETTLLTGTDDFSGQTSQMKLANNNANLYTQAANTSLWSSVSAFAGSAEMECADAADDTTLKVQPDNLYIDGTGAATGSFTSQDGKTITVTKGIITAIV